MILTTLPFASTNVFAGAGLCGYLATWGAEELDEDDELEDEELDEWLDEELDDDELDEEELELDEDDDEELCDDELLDDELELLDEELKLGGIGSQCSVAPGPTPWNPAAQAHLHESDTSHSWPWLV